MTEMFKLTSLGCIPVRGRACYAVENPVDTQDFSELQGKYVEIDGGIVRVVGVERFAHYPPWHKGERIGLLVEDPALELLAKLKQLPDEKRLSILAAFCSSCGTLQPEVGRPCQCWNDE